MVSDRRCSTAHGGGGVPWRRRRRSSPSSCPRASAASRRRWRVRWGRDAPTSRALPSAAGRGGPSSSVSRARGSRSVRSRSAPASRARTRQCSVAPPSSSRAPTGSRAPLARQQERCARGARCAHGALPGGHGASRRAPAGARTGAGAPRPRGSHHHGGARTRTSPGRRRRSMRSSPLKVLARGYAIAYREDAVATSTAAFAPGDRHRRPLCRRHRDRYGGHGRRGCAGDRGRRRAVAHRMRADPARTHLIGETHGARGPR